jgi:hypothetical protein
MLSAIFQACSPDGPVESGLPDAPDTGTLPAVIDSADFDEQCGIPYQACIPINDERYVLAYRGGTTRNEGWLLTFAISGDGGIEIINKYRFSSNAAHTSILPLSETVYLVAYKGQASNLGHLFTISINKEGDIIPMKLDEWEFTSFCYFPTLVDVAGDIRALAYIGPERRGQLGTFTADKNGTIGKEWLDTLEYEKDTVYYNRIIPAAGGYYALAYTAGDYRVVTVKIAPDSGEISGGIRDRMSLDIPAYDTLEIFRISDSSYGLCYQLHSDSALATFHINDGYISEAVDQEQIDAGEGKYVDAIPAYEDLYLFVSSSPAGPTYVRCRKISNDGTIGDEVASYRTSDNFTRHHILLPVKPDTYGLVYQRYADYRGRIITFQLNRTKAVSLGDTFLPF